MDKYSNGWEATANGHSSPRLPTVDEALQYTPFTSIVPCNPDVLPVPAAYPPPSSNVFLDNDEKHAARSLLKALNKQADSTQNASARLQQQLHQVQKLLKQDPPTEYKFKELPNVGKIFQQPVESPATKETEEEKGKRERERKEREKLHIPRPKLGAFTKMALRTVKVPYRYPTPDSPDRQQHGGQQNATAPKKTPQHAQIPSPDPSITAPPSNASRLSPKVKNEVSFPVNGFDVGSAQLTPRPSPGKAAVVVPDLPVASQRTEYEEFPELDAQLEVTGGSVSRKRIHEQPQQGLKALNFNIDQRQKGDEAVEILSQELDNVFEAENEVLATGGNGISVFENQYLSMENIDDTTVAVLVPPTQYKLESAVQKVIALGRMNSIPLDETLRLQKLFGDVVSLANTKDLKIGNEISEADVEEWTLRLETAHSGLLASRNILRVMTACFEEKRIQSEGLVNSILTLLRQVMDSCIIPVVESRASGASAESFRIFSKHQKPLSHLLQAFSRVLKALGDFLSKVDVDESAITTVEALTQGLIFAENAPTEKDAALTIQRFENLRRAAMDVVAKIFFSYSEQRPSIINGILTSLEKLPVTRQSARHFRLAEGKPIQLVSALIMQLIQTSASSSSATNKARKKIPSKDDEGENSGSEESEDDVPLQAQLLRATQIDMGDEASMDVGTMMMSLKDVAHSHYESAFNNAHDVMKYLVRRAMTATKTGDQPYRNLLDIFTEDFISVLGTAEWPAAELLLQVLARHLFSIMKNDKSTVPAQNMALDLMGTLGAGIFNLEDHSRSLHRGLDSSTSEIESSLSQITDEILEENVNDLDALSFNGPTRIVLEFLHSKDLGDSQLMSARGYHVIQWAESLNAAYDIARKTEGRDLEQFKPLASKLRKMVRDLQWLDAE
ncbi:MAG: Sister chromatid cohesion protein 2 [Bogoriella megaspora]|nr:MAG: Sister chromatid cohesion protein 2 [Bogoriella megaspora]